MMNQLVIGDSIKIEIRNAIKTLQGNIRLLKAKMEIADLNSGVGQKAHHFYAAKLSQQEAVLQWLTRSYKLSA